MRAKCARSCTSTPAAADLAEGRAALNTARFDLALPENQRKLKAAEKLAALAGELGCSLPQLAVAFPLVHRR